MVCLIRNFLNLFLYVNDCLSGYRYKDGNVFPSWNLKHFSTLNLISSVILRKLCRSAACCYRKLFPFAERFSQNLLSSQCSETSQWPSLGSFLPIVPRTQWSLSICQFIFISFGRLWTISLMITFIPVIYMCGYSGLNFQLSFHSYFLLLYVFSQFYLLICLLSLLLLYCDF